MRPKKSISFQGGFRQYNFVVSEIELSSDKCPVLILAGERPGEFPHPRISQKASDNNSVLSLQVSSLEFLGHIRSQIYLVTSDGPLDSDDLGIEQILVSSSSKGSLNSFLYALRDFGPLPEQFLVLYSDYIPNIEDLETLGSISNRTRLLVERPLRFDASRTRIFSRGNSIESIEPPDYGHLLPWSVFGGAMAVTNSDIKLLLASRVEDSEIDLLTALGRISNNGSLKAVNPVPQRIPLNNPPEEGPKVSRLLGGSLADLHKQVLIRKSAKGEDGEKLKREARWLKEQSTRFPNRFPELLGLSESENSTSLDISFIEKQSIRNLVLSGAWGFDESSSAIRSVLTFMFENIYSETSENKPDSWITSRHLDRFRNRSRPELYSPPFLEGCFRLLLSKSMVKS